MSALVRKCNPGAAFAVSVGGVGGGGGKDCVEGGAEGQGEDDDDDECTGLDVAVLLPPRLRLCCLCLDEWESGLDGVLRRSVGRCGMKCSKEDG